jgi:hypothetical protein
MGCGNTLTLDEGESGETYDPLLIVPAKEGFESGSVSPDTVSETEIEDFTFTFRLDSKYPVGKRNTVKIVWNTLNFLVDTLTLNGVTCTVSDGTGTCMPGKDINAGSDLVFKFDNVYVDAEVGQNLNEAYFDFVKEVTIKGDWSTYGIGNGTLSKSDSYNGYVYYCKSLDSDTSKCDNVERTNVRVTIEKDSNKHKINSVFTSPNNLRNEVNKWWSDMLIEFDIGADMPYRGDYSKIYLTIPQTYDVNTNIDSDDWLFYCFPNFKATCAVSSAKKVTLSPKETVSGVKKVWII